MGFDFAEGIFHFCVFPAVRWAVVLSPDYKWMLAMSCYLGMILLSRAIVGYQYE
jgi:hypothetical protein